MAATVRARSAVNLLLNTGGNLSERFEPVVVSAKVAAEVLIFRGCCCSQLPDLDQIRYHAPSILQKCRYYAR
jgi:hypothetical protein